VYGFLGPNGAGKSTTIRLLMNFIRPTEGSAQIHGLDTQKDSVAVKQSIGYLASDPGLYQEMTGNQYLDYMEELQLTTNPTYRRELIQRLRAEPQKRLRTLSRGNKQKFGIIQAFMHQPRLLILDEPTSGLDPLMQEVFYELIHEAKQRGASAFISSHILSEVQKTCDRVGIIKSGQLVSEQSVTEITHKAEQLFHITFASTPPVDQLNKVLGLHIITHKGNELTIKIHGDLAPLFSVLSEHTVLKLYTRHPDLEDIFMDFYREDQEDTI